MATARERRDLLAGVSAALQALGPSAAAGQYVIAVGL